MTNIKSLAYAGLKWTTVSKVYCAVINVLQIAILARFISKNDFGLMGIAVLVNSFCKIFVDMGMATAAMHEPNLTREHFSSLYWFNLFTGFFFTIIVSSFSPFVAQYYRRDELVDIISLTSLIIFINSVFSLQRTLQQKKMNFRFMSIVEVLSATIMLLVNVILAVRGYGVYSLVWSTIIGSSLTAISYLVLSFKEKNVILHLSMSEIKDALKIGVYQVGSSSLDFLSREMDSFIISSSMSMEFFGVYTLFKNITRHIYGLINPIVTSVLTPVLAKVQEDKEKLSRGYIKCVEMLAFINFPVYSILAFSSFSIISILYGSSYTEYTFIMMCLAFFYAFQSCGNPIGSLLIATGRTDRGFIWTIFRIVFIAVYLYIASSFSINVFAFLLFVSPLITSYPSWHIILRDITSISFPTSFFVSVKPFLICALMSPLYFLDRYLNSPVFGLVVVSLIFLTGYYMLNYIFRRSFLGEFQKEAKGQFKIK